MTEEERQIYHYYLGKAVEEANGGIVSEETAKKYVDSITEAINARHAQKMANGTVKVKSRAKKDIKEDYSSNLPLRAS